jgi:death-on-curing protein
MKKFSKNSQKPKKIVFISLESALSLYQDIMATFGGAPGIRDQGLLESALAQPQMTIFGQYAHQDIFDMASAYCFHIIKNHPFTDGNKRTGLLLSLTFLDINDIPIQRTFDELYHLAIAVANSSMNKKDIAKFFREVAK